MIRSLLKRTKFHRAALPLLAMLLTTTTAWAEKEAVTYIKADGTSSTQEATILTGNEIEIGSYNQTTWYVVKNTQEGVDVAYTKPKTLRGTVNIILEDGAEMTATSVGTTIWGVDGSTLNIYGQTNGTGRLSSESTAHQAIAINGDINIYGGVISASATKSYTSQAILANNASVNIYGGTVTATSSSGKAIQASTAVNIYGGAVTATGYQGISAGNITLGWTNHDDYIKANSYEATNGITIADGKTFYDGTGTSYASGTATANSIAGKTLRTYDYRTVSFNSNGGSAVDEQIIAVNGKATEPTAPTREGYTFVRWLKDGAPYNFSSSVTANIALTATWATEVAYIDATGTLHENMEAIPLDNTMTTLPAGTYVVNSDVDYTGKITLSGDVTLILADGCKMNMTVIDRNGIVSNSNFAIYGQAQGTGSLVIDVTTDDNHYAPDGINANNLIINGGIINITAHAATGATFDNIRSRGIVSNNVTINGGQITVNGENGISCKETITLGYTKENDYIETTCIKANQVLIAKGRKLTDGTNVYSGKLSDEQVSALANQTLTPKGWEGDGSVTTPYQITDSDDLLLLAYNVNQGNTYEDKYFKLKGDIKFDRSTDADDITSTENNFPVIGDAYQINGYGYWKHKFQGHFDGNNKTISGIRIYKGGKDWTDGYVGLFGYLEQGAVVKYLTISDCRITGHNYTGGIVGNNSGGTITNCHVDNTVYIHAAQDGACYHGGIAGNNYSNEKEGIVSTISNCTSKVQLTVFDGIDISKNSTNPTTNYGGIVGVNSGTLTDNYVEGATIPQVTRAYGGIVGQNDVSDNRNYYKECTIAGVARQTNMACGDPNVNGGIDVTYRLMSNGKKIGDADALTLQISGTGAMADFYFSDDRPWDDVRSNITDIAMSDGVTTIGSYAFTDCQNLGSIKISSDVKTIGERAFMHCWALTDVTIPASVESIGNQAFADCETLKTIHMKNPYAPTLVADFRGFNFNFNACNALEGILTPSAEAMNNYASADSWRAYADKLGAEGYCGDKNENDGKNVIWSLVPTGEKYQNNALLYALNIDVNPDVENQTNFNMGNADYRNQTNNPWLNMGDFISELNIGEGVTSIAEQAFNSLKLISSVVIPRSIEKIAGSAFGDDSHTCSNLEWVYLKRYDPTAEKKITNLDFFEGKCNTFIGCPELKCIIVDNIDAYNAATSADYWDDDMKAKLREYKPVLFAASATNEWATFCTDIEYFKPKDCTVYTVSGVNSEQVQVAEVEGDVIPAYTPVLIKRAEGKLTADIKAEFSNVVENVSTSGTSYTNINKDSRADQGTVIANFDGGCVYGNTGAVQNPNNKGWVANIENVLTYALYGDKFLLIDTDEGIPTHRFIMRVSYGDVGKARSLMIGVGGDTTGMEELKNEKIEELNSEWYDLQGRKLGSKPTRKGLYINNGKKIVIK